MDAIAWIAEQRISAALERGELNNLPGQGLPLHLDDDNHVPPDLRMAYKVLRNAGYVPEEIAERKEIQSLVDMLESCDDERETVRATQRLKVLLSRVSLRRNAPALLDESTDYYAKAVARVSRAMP